MCMPAVFVLVVKTHFWCQSEELSTTGKNKTKQKAPLKEMQDMSKKDMMCHFLGLEI